MPNSKRSKYSAKFKLQVVKFAKNTVNNSTTGKEFDVNEKLVRDWGCHIEKYKLCRRISVPIEEKMPVARDVKGTQAVGGRSAEEQLHHYQEPATNACQGSGKAPQHCQLLCFQQLVHKLPGMAQLCYNTSK